MGILQIHQNSLFLRKIATLFVQVYNTAQSRAFMDSLLAHRKIISDCRNKDAIRDYYVSDILRALSCIDSGVEFTAVSTYINTIDRDGIINTSMDFVVGRVTEDDYFYLLKFIEAHSGMPCKDYRARQSAFTLTSSITTYLLVKDTLDNGSGCASIDAILQQAIEQKEPDFFAAGHFMNALVMDRVCLDSDVVAAQCLSSHYLK